MKRFMLILACLLMMTGFAMAQSSQGRKVIGVVTSAETGKPIQGARVFVNGTSYGTVTDAEGTFNLQIPNKYKVLTVTFFGMQTENVAISNRMNIMLRDNAKNLDEAVVIAYGTAKKSEFTGSVSTMKSENLEKLQVSNVTKALTGSIAGVQAQSSNGQPGTSATVLVRGVGSINASVTPLYVVDGVPFDGDISSINPADIASISVEKDAAASALYGARSGNGVVMITTKKGKKGNARVTFDMKIGQNSREIKNYDVLQTPGAYIEKAYQALYNGQYYNTGTSAAAAHLYANQVLMSGSNKAGGLGYNIYTVPDGQYLIGTNGKLNPNATLGYSDGTNYYTPDDWDRVTFSNNLRQEYNASISGGNNQMDYFASFNYLNDQGVIEHSSLTRYSFRFNTNYQINNWMKVGANLAYSYQNSHYPDEQTTTNSRGNAFAVAYSMAPIYPIYIRTADGTVARDALGRVIYDYGDGKYSAGNRPTNNMCNPYASLLYDRSQYLSDIFSSNMYATITPLAGLSITGRFGLNIDNTRANFGSNPFYGQFATLGGTVDQAHQRTRGRDYQLIAEYRHSFADVHHMSVMAGYDGYSLTVDELTGHGANLYNPLVYVIGNTIDSKIAGAASGSYATKGYIFRGTYDYKETYFASASFRRDGSSRFAKGQRWGSFWSASAAWEMTKETWMKPLTWVDQLKLRASFGQQGNDGIGNDYAYIDQYTMTGADGVFSDGSLKYKGNPNLKWEKSNSFNIGFDFSVLKQKLYGSIEYYSRQTSNMLYNKTVAGSAGYTSIPMNIGKMRNNGVELDLHSLLINQKDMTLTLDFNATFQGNKIIKLHPDLKGEWINGARIFREGKSMYSLYLVKWAGVAPQNGTSTYYTKVTDDAGNVTGYQEKTTSYQGGEALYWAKDDKGNEYKTNDWSAAQSSNRHATKSLLPKVYGGFGATFTFHGFDASFLIQYSLGGHIFDSGYQTFMHGGDGSNAGFNWHKDILHSWTPSNTHTDVPRVDVSDQYTNATSDRFLKSADYFNLNNVQIGYTLPKNFINKFFIQNLRIFVSADNVCLISARRGLDPRRSFVSSTTQTYSPLRSVSAGLTITF